MVLCANKLDGRRYAMKKIRLQAKTLSQNNKILRFVRFQYKSYCSCSVKGWRRLVVHRFSYSNSLIPLCLN